VDLVFRCGEVASALLLTSAEPSRLSDFVPIRLRQRRPREEGLTGGQGGDVDSGHAGDLGEGFLCEKGLMCSDENVGESEQAREFVVVQDLAREILEEDGIS
jgi:hypothetical protein